MNVPNENRVSFPNARSSLVDGPNGCFQFRGPCGMHLNVIASDGMGWDHVSVSCLGLRRLPNWREMDFVKKKFWEDSECVMQLHVPVSEHVNNAEVLHLWRPQKAEIPMPPSIMVGIKGVSI